jgi:hypothetical protein
MTTLTTLDNGVTLPLCEAHRKLVADHVIHLARKRKGVECGVCVFTRKLLRQAERMLLPGQPADRIWKIGCFGNAAKSSAEHVRVFRGSILLLELTLDAYYGIIEWLPSPGYEIYGEVEFEVPKNVLVVLWREENAYQVMIEMRPGTGPVRTILNPVQNLMNTFGGATRWIPPATSNQLVMSTKGMDSLTSGSFISSYTFEQL